MKENSSRAETGIKLFVIISALIGLAMGLSDALFANYFKEAYAVTAQQRGLIEFPRELPGVLAMFCIAAISFMGNIRSAIIAQLVSIVGIIALAVTRPAFPIMLVFLFIFSLGVHVYVPLGDSIGLSLAHDHNRGKMLGRFYSARMAFLMIAGIITFVGFRFGWFRFDTPVAVFFICAVTFAIITVFLVILYKLDLAADAKVPKVKFVFKKEYMRYYVICALFGSRKQIMLVYSPWVLIDLLDFKADTISILAVIGSLIGIFFMPVVGRLIDRLGVRKVMMIEALAFVAVYTAYGFLSRWVNTNVVALSGVIMMLVYLLNIIDRMSAQFNMVRAIYMRSIAKAPEDLTPSLSLGMSIDHVMAIIGSYACGVIWYIWGPEYVFIVAGVLSLMNLIAARGIKSEFTSDTPL